MTARHHCNAGPLQALITSLLPVHDVGQSPPLSMLLATRQCSLPATCRSSLLAHCQLLSSVLANHPHCGWCWLLKSLQSLLTACHQCVWPLALNVALWESLSHWVPNPPSCPPCVYCQLRACELRLLLCVIGCVCM